MKSSHEPVSVLRKAKSCSRSFAKRGRPVADLRKPNTERESWNFDDDLKISILSKQNQYETYETMDEEADIHPSW